MGLLLAAFWWIVSARFVAGIAASKRRNSAAWFLLGVLFGPLAVIAAMTATTLNSAR